MSRFILELRSPVSGRWSEFQRGEHEAADYLLGNTYALSQLEQGKIVRVSMGDGSEIEARFSLPQPGEPK